MLTRAPAGASAQTAFTSIDHVLHVEDDPNVLRVVARHLAAAGLEAIPARSGKEALELFQLHRPSTVLLDLGLPDTSGQVLLKRFLELDPSVSVVVLTAQARVDDVVECMQLGARDFVRKPFDPTRLQTTVENARKQRELIGQVETLTRTLRTGRGVGAVRGESTAMQSVLSLVERAAPSDVTVLLQGESGTGKEVVAQAIHVESQRRRGPWIAVNCGAIPEGLIESELFGHAKGAFTGAERARKGYFEQAQGGTLFLDEVAELRVDLQVKLLRVLQERKVQPMGDARVIDVDVRLIAATNRDLKAEVRARRFRDDLFYRLSVFPIELPPLRERYGDVRLLAEHFLAQFCARHRKEIESFSAEAMAALKAHSWPGNVRQLENIVERAVILEDGPSVSLESLPDEVVCALDSAGTQAPQRPTPPAPSEILTLEDEERRIIARALTVTGYNVREAARRLGIGRATIYRKIERYGLGRKTS